MDSLLLTGATSFLGRQFLNRSHHNITIIPTSLHGDHESEIDPVDITQLGEVQNFLQDKNISIVVHAGALVDLSRNFAVGERCFNINTLGTMHLLEAVKAYKPLFLFISSEEVYGNGPIPFIEDQMISPPSPYAISKAAAESLCLWYGKEYSFPVIILRVGTFYGPGQPPTKYFSQIIQQALEHASIPVNSGTKKRDYVYVDDVIDVLTTIIDRYQRDGLSIPTGIFNIAGGSSHTLLEVIDMIKTYTHSNSEVKIGAIPDRITEREEWLADIQKVKAAFNWQPKTALVQGLKLTIQSIINRYENETT